MIKEIQPGRSSNSGRVNGLTTRLIRADFAEMISSIRKRQPVFGTQFLGVLNKLDEHSKKNTFEMAEHYCKVSYNSFKFLVIAIEAYLADTPRNDLSHCWISVSPFKTDEQQFHNILTLMIWINTGVRNDIIPPRPLDDALLKYGLNIRKKDRIIANRYIRYILSLKEKHLSIAEIAKQKASSIVPETDYFHDLFAYYENRVSQFFNELELRARFIRII